MDDNTSESSKGSKGTNVRNISLNINRVFACENRSVFTTTDNKIFVGQKSYSMIPLSEYEPLCQIEKQIKNITLGGEHCLVLDGKEKKLK